MQAITFDVFSDVDENIDCYIINGAEFAAVAEGNPDVKIFAPEMAVSRFLMLCGYACNTKFTCKLLFFVYVYYNQNLFKFQ